jgi:hypothetical protein
MKDVSTVRLCVLRATYLLIAGGQAVVTWPSIISHSPQWPLMSSVVACMLGAMALIAALGIRYSLQMIPILLFELAWKTIWLTAVALPLWLGGTMDARTAETAGECLMVVIVLVALPWRYVVANYVLKDGERWATTRSAHATDKVTAV